MTDSSEPVTGNCPSTGENYPVPLSPPLPAISKNLELARAMAASSKSSLFALSANDVIYEDEWLIAVNKPQGIYCENVLAAVPRLLCDSANAGIKTNLPELHLANRLDRDTSGVMVITKSHKVASKLVKAFTDHTVSKSYIAFCVGTSPKWKKIHVKSGHGRSKFGVWRVYAAADVGRSLPGGSIVRDMETYFEVLSVNGKNTMEELQKFRKEEEETIVVHTKSLVDIDSQKDEVLIRARPRSGRTHQIRLHCQYLGIPIRGDVKYEGVTEWNGKTYDSHELHAESLYFVHPITGIPLKLQAPLPSWASQALQPQQQEVNSPQSFKTMP
ncbi:RNA pseudouridine synthase 1 [Cucumis melo var. makuwa]|uniref:RNA pseudouridine synthase 1 n=2 Tax=Cucumis melo TaxID=3656 RepID=A0A5A7TX25_CUCMM|nr:RNA pseudouridine synthase 1 [Cucumis melo]KAA0048062.1 RNA pseudouridine synthase 1 [Cucumis melo var. makuwa]TYJ96474.1 RNA pseudouridine synthase 1 [Cucumis melo var. makuwa]